MIRQASHTLNTALQMEALSDLQDVVRMSLLFFAAFISLSISIAVSISPVVDVISINTVIGILSLITILPILISGIINLILIIR